MSKICLTLLLLASNCAVLGRAQEDDSSAGEQAAASQANEYTPQSFIHPLTNMPGSSEDVETSFLFPGHSDQKFPIGETVTVLCHFTNNAEHYPLNVTAIMGSLNSPFEFNFHVQNYSYKPLGIVVRPDEEFTFSYEFQLHPDLQPVEYSLAHTIFYEDNTRGYSTTFFNQTVELTYPTDEFDIYTMAQLVLSLSACMFVIGLLIWIFKSDTSPKRKSAGANSAADDWEVDDLSSQKKRQ
mmetsp:Transcript_28652/g.48361  ORF Transcript_28652/g.48361 Transcript_28652/m.48361 type:complete len:240 (-) Transcript_28652:242-961(-)|eukprot:CAMPEP_0114415476 /NCGR_PEP_ID=MMETSP0103-20121206/1929_1 /TAXON_ID=37642 ORGANISM="Paraphysomonas imperforata, Strain PA2" /NCGR_SAMPLE_ID=MMETSP0103 /ASSEMBLY_ACC=CAM_ASM_000201 /LENGTH=239 /DNA_ID=CAMNT_0001583661 /DNA_START=36 /DNA_END=755 /DNA_ORIENTATION=-